jgi:hypothetical protein
MARIGTSASWSARAQGQTLPQTEQNPLALVCANRATPDAASGNGARPAVAASGALTEAFVDCTCASNHIL